MKMSAAQTNKYGPVVRLDFRRSLSGPVAWRSAGSSPDQRLVIEPTRLFNQSDCAIQLTWGVEVLTYVTYSTYRQNNPDYQALNEFWQLLIKTTVPALHGFLRDWACGWEGRRGLVGGWGRILEIWFASTTQLNLTYTVGLGSSDPYLKTPGCLLHSQTLLFRE